MNELERMSRDYDRVEQAIRFLEDHFLEQPGLGEVADGLGLSEHHFQRLFSRWVGISPKRFLQFLTKEHAKELLAGSHSILDAAYGAGLSGPGRLHDLFITCEAVTPGEYKRLGEGIRIDYGFHPSPFGECMLAVTDKGICSLAFLSNRKRKDPLLELERQWPRADLVLNHGATGAVLGKVFPFSAGQGPVLSEQKPAPLHIHVRGTNFQIKVWEALLRIPLGKAVSYEDIARHIDMPKAARAVGNAVGSNPIPFIIPCHRVLRKMGDFGNYGGGPARKKAILGWEAARLLRA